jgi:hypothetical protein
MNPCPSFHLPLLHTLVEERVGERRLLLRGGFMGRNARPTFPGPPKNGPLKIFLKKALDKSVLVF